jgi:hypothetical protein
MSAKFEKKPFYSHLYVQVLIGDRASARLIGYFYPRSRQGT